MKKQINPTIKAHLIRSAFYVLLLLAVCVIPFALAQRNTTKRSTAKPRTVLTPGGKTPQGVAASTGAVGATAVTRASGIALSRQARQLSTATSSTLPERGTTKAKNQPRRGPAFVEIGRVNTPQLSTPKAPAAVLYDQYDNSTGTAFESNLHVDDPSFVDYMADDFVVPGGETWTITEVDAMGLQFGPGGATFNVAFYTNGAGNLPDTEVYSTNNGTYTTNGIDFVITIPPAILTSGTYWVLVQGNGSNNPFNSWFWQGRSVQSNDTAAWQQPGNAYGRNCLAWQRKPICFSEIPNDFDQVFRLVGTTGGGTPTPTPTPGCVVTPWQTVASMPIDVYGAACASDGTFVYCAGGYSFSQPGLVNAFNRYDPVADTWTALAPIPTGSSMASAVYDPTGNKIYVFGGSDPDAQTVNNLNQIYDIASDSWSAGPPLPDVRSFMASGYNPGNGKIYLVGGYNTAFVDSGQPDTWEYDPAAGTYTNKTDFPELAGGYASGIINGHLYVAGGRDINFVSLNTVWDYDIAADTWTQKGDMPPDQNNVPGSAVALDNLWVFGGGNPFVASSARKGTSHSMKPPVDIRKAAFPWAHVKGLTPIPTTANTGRRYDPATDTWFTAPNMNALRAFTSGAAVGNKVVAAGGYNGSTTVASAETLDVCIGGGTPTPTPTPTCSPGSLAWQVKAPVPFNARGPFVVSDGTFVYVGGGYDGTNVHTDTLRYDPVADTWTPLAPAPDEHFLSQAVIDNGKIYNIAGFNLGGQSTTTRIYDIASDTWTTGAPIPEPLGLSDHATALFNGKIYIAGGFNGSGAINTVRVYDIATDSWSDLAPLPMAVYLPGFGIINGKLYIASGNDGAIERPELQIYDIATNTWSTGASVPTPVTAPGSTVFDDGTGPKLYLFSGASPFPTTITATQIYDPVTDSWGTGPNMNVDRVWFYGGAVGSSGILASGGDHPAFVPSNPNELLTGGPCGTPTPTPTPGACQFHVLIVYADSEGLPTQLQSEIQAEPNVVAVDLFDATVGTPTLAQLQQYEIAVPFSNSTFLDSDTLGNNLADYVDGGGIVVQYGFAHYGPGQPFGINGRWASDGYNAYDYSTNLEFNPFSLGTFNAGHPLMAGVTALNSNFANIVTPNAAATEVAQNSLGESLVAFRPVGGHTTVGVTAYVGAAATQSGDWGKVIVNAGNWLLNCEGTPTPTPTATATATATATPTATATATATATPTATATATPTATRPPPTPRPRPTPFPRPTP
jgi:N-acetylneuraminic acid mutarotase